MDGTWRRVLAGAVGLVATLGIGDARSAPSDDDPGADPGVLPPGASPYGASYEDWAGQWVEWAYSMPTTMHPLFDSADCSEGQSGNVWFLGGTFQAAETEPGEVLGAADRECTIPSGTALFFPVLNTINTWSLEDQPTPTEDELRAVANLVQDQAGDMELTLTCNGVDVEMDDDDLTGHRVESALLTLGPLPADSLTGDDEGTFAIAVTDGTYVMLTPLPVGTCTLHFGGTFDLTELGVDLRFVLDIVYDLEIVPKGLYQAP